MIPLWLVCAAMLAEDPPAADAAPVPDRAAYQVVKAKVGRDAPSLVKLALWCESHGLTAEREKHLAQAVLADPSNAAARGMLGLVAHAGRWMTPDQVGEAVRSDEGLALKLSEYNRLRDRMEAEWDREERSSRSMVERYKKMGDDKRALAWQIDVRKAQGGRAQAHVRLGAWCEKNGLPAEATAHYTQAVVLNPYAESGWKHLGYVLHDGRWMSREAIAAEAKEAGAQRHADRAWLPRLEKDRRRLGEAAHREAAERDLAEVDDRRAIPSIARVFGDDPSRLARLYGQIDAPAATVKLAGLALYGTSAAARGEAIRALRARDARDFAGNLVDLIHAPMAYKLVRDVGGPGMPGALQVTTPRFTMLRTYDAPPPFTLGSTFYGYVGYDGNGLPVAARGRELDRMARESSIKQERDLEMIEARTMGMIAEANFKAAVSRERLVADVREIEVMNAQATATNERIAEVLRESTDVPSLQSDDEDGWHRWYYDKLGYRYESPAPVVLTVAAAVMGPSPSITSCFVAGTPVRTRDGRRPIESLRVGDQVLSQDAATGSLSFEPVTAVHHNPPGATIRVALDDGETIVASIYHRFWRTGRGWAMARELKPGDVLRTLAGRAKVVSAASGDVEPVYNLDVARSRTFFVGEHDALVHDNTLPDPHLKPFDADMP